MSCCAWLTGLRSIGWTRHDQQQPLTRETGVTNTAAASWTIFTLVEIRGEAEQLKTMFLYRTGDYVAATRRTYQINGARALLSALAGCRCPRGNNCGPVACPAQTTLPTAGTISGATIISEPTSCNAINLLNDASLYATYVLNRAGAPLNICKSPSLTAEVVSNQALAWTSPASQVTYTDTTLERARRLASLTYELIEVRVADVTVQTVELLHDVSSTTERVIEQMVGVLALIHQEMEGSGTDGEDTKEDEAALAAVMAQDAQVLDGQDPRIALMLRRTLARVRGESNGFDEAEKEDLHASFLRFKVPASADIHKDDLDALLNFIGRWVPPEEAITDMARKITMYDYMDFDEFLQFMTHYDEFERAEQERIFKKYDQDGSGNISAPALAANRAMAGKRGKKCRQRSNPAPADGTRTCSKSHTSFDAGLSSLLGNAIGVEEFRERFFEQRPLHIQRAGSNKYYAQLDGVSTPERLFKLMEEGAVPVYRVNMFRCKDGSNKETPNPPPTSAADVRRLFAEGWSIQWLQPQQEHDALASLVVALETEFGCLVGVNAYLTPPGTQGLAPHWDDVEVFVLQLGGKKAWTLHASSSAAPSPTLPRFSSGDIDLASLSPPLLSPKLSAGDLLYFPRGTIHYAPNKDSTEASVHLTVSAFQRQSLYDLVQKTFEEAMSELWEDEALLRRALPWPALATGAWSELGSLRSSVASQLRALADMVEAEAASPPTSPGPVASALAELGAEFVKHRMPPQSQATEVAIITPGSMVRLEPTALALLPRPGDEEGATLHHYGHNSRRNHMMNHPKPAMENLGSERLMGEEQGEEEDLEEDEEVEPAGAKTQMVSAHVEAALRHLGAASAQGHAKVEEILRKADVPQEAWSEVCQVLTQLAAVGVAEVKEGPARPAARKRQRTK
ncbi:RIOX2 [Symbiodinium microadriaticum]|nr:RIOX2 [Symbiodinium microadriaticum]